jgi:hypothetical protein
MAQRADVAEAVDGRKVAVRFPVHGQIVGDRKAKLCG